jgi:hypothetical protein
LAGLQLLISIAMPGFGQAIFVPPDGLAYLAYFDPYARYESIYNWPGSRSPLLPWIIHYLLQGSPGLVLVLNIGLAASVPALVYRILRRLGGSAQAALIGGLVFSVMPTTVAFSRTLLTETLATVLMGVAVDRLLDRDRMRAPVGALGTGAIVGFLTLSRVQFAVFAAIASVWIALHHRERDRRRSGIKPASWFSAGVAGILVFLPIVNLTFGGHAVLTSHFGLVNHGQGLLEQLQASNDRDRTLLELYRSWRTAHPSDPPPTTTPNVIWMAMTETGLSFPETVAEYRRLTLLALLENPRVYAAAVAANVRAYLFEQPWTATRAFSSEPPNWIGSMSWLERRAKQMLAALTLLAMIWIASTTIAGRFRSSRGDCAGDTQSALILMAAAFITDLLLASLMERGENSRYWVPMSPLMFAISWQWLSACAGWALRTGSEVADS